jgi:hypothetical protein
MCVALYLCGYSNFTVEVNKTKREKTEIGVVWTTDYEYKFVSSTYEKIEPFIISFMLLEEF